MLIVIIAGVWAMWTAVLPAVGRHPEVRAHVQHLDEKGIDPAALFYTDLQGMERIEERVNFAVRHRPEAFWLYRTAFTRDPRTSKLAGSVGPKVICTTRVEKALKRHNIP